MSDETDDFRQQVEEADLDHPDAWSPDPGDVLIATVQEYDRAMTQWGEQYVCNVVNEDTGEPVAVWLSHTVLLDAFKRKKPEPGERIGIKFHGRDEQKDYAKYSLFVDRDGSDAVPDFSDAEPKDKAAVTTGDAPGEAAGGAGDRVADDLDRPGEGRSSGPSGEYGSDYGAEDDIPF